MTGTGVIYLGDTVRVEDGWLGVVQVIHADGLAVTPIAGHQYQVLSFRFDQVERVAA